MTEKELKSWEKRRVLGRDQYVWRYGVLGFGVPAGGVYALYLFFADSSVVWSALLFKSLLFCLGGVLYGYSTWSRMEAKYKEVMAEAIPQNLVQPIRSDSSAQGRR
ncbi:hypothetical protein [Hahella ganghwensis]|uniref:hypothetical protein n=1 Tax=Hahella ganghwensis TaxID=286420 RepID=UPI00037E8788|nr:hypothetical protein [Hahella ganghwensis]